MKKIFYIFLCSLLICIQCTSSVCAKDTRLSDLFIVAKLKEDGSAHIKERWTIDLHEGSEVYKVFDHMGALEIKNFKVKDDLGNIYDNIGEWEVKASKADKDGKCGIVYKDDGYELCFGIGKYGSRVYELSYDVMNFVQQYKTSQGFNYAFFSDMSIVPEYAKVVVQSSYKFDKNNAKIWGFGYDGSVVFNRYGQVVMESKSPVKNKMQLLMSFDKNFFKHAYPNDRAFEDVLSEAKEGSIYSSPMDMVGHAFSKDNPMRYVYRGIAFCVGIGILVIIIGIYQYNKTKRFYFKDGQSLRKDVDFFRDIPCDKDLFMFYYLAKLVGLINNENRYGLLSGILLRWIQNDYIHFEKTQEKFLVFKSDGFRIEFQKDIPVSNYLENKLLGYFLEAAGSNGILETKEFEKWCGEHYKKLDDWFDEVEASVVDDLCDRHLYSLQGINIKVLWMNVVKDVDTYDESIRDEMEHIIGLKKFLEEMSLIDEKSVIEVKMWEEYLIFASILGIAETVQEQLKEFCPTFSEQSQIDSVYTLSMINTFTRNSIANVNGAGGSASLSGGGSSYSGGGGGGVR